VEDATAVHEVARHVNDDEEEDEDEDDDADDGTRSKSRCGDRRPRFTIPYRRVHMLEIYLLYQRVNVCQTYSILIVITSQSLQKNLHFPIVLPVLITPDNNNMSPMTFMSQPPQKK